MQLEPTRRTVTEYRCVKIYLKRKLTSRETLLLIRTAFCVVLMNRQTFKLQILYFLCRVYFYIRQKTYIRYNLHVRLNNSYMFRHQGATVQYTAPSDALHINTFQLDWILWDHIRKKQIFVRMLYTESKHARSLAWNW